MRRLKRLKMISPAFVATVGCAIVTGWLVFSTPVHGYGNNGSFDWILSTNGLYWLKPSNHGGVTSQLGIMKYHNPLYLSHLTSQDLVIQLAIWFNRVFYSQRYFNLQFLGAVYLVLYVGSISLFCRGLLGQRRRLRDYCLAGLVVIVLADTAFTLYFNSFYPEALTYILMIAVVGFCLCYLRYKTGNKWQIIFFTLLAALLLLTQESASLLTLSFILMGVTFLTRSSQSVTVVMIIGFLMVGGFSANNLTRQNQAANKFQALSQGILLNQRPERAVKTAHIEPQFSLLRGQAYFPNAYAASLPTDTLIQHRVMNQYDLPWLVMAYARDQQQFETLLDASATNLTLIKRQQVATVASGSTVHHQFLTTSFMLFSQSLATFFPRKYTFDCLVAGIVISVYLIDIWLRRRHHHPMGRGWVVIGLMTAVILVPVMSLFLYGMVDLASHLLVVVLSLSLGGLVLVADLMTRRLWWRWDR